MDRNLWTYLSRALSRNFLSYGPSSRAAPSSWPEHRLGLTVVCPLPMCPLPVCPLPVCPLGFRALLHPDSTHPRWPWGFLIPPRAWDELLWALHDIFRRVYPYLITMNQGCTLKPEAVCHTTWNHVRLSSLMVGLSSLSQKKREKKCSVLNCQVLERYVFINTMFTFLIECIGVTLVNKIICVSAV